MSNPFRTERSNGFEPTVHVPRPHAGLEPYKALNSEALVIAQEAWDEANADRKAREERAAKMAEWDQTDEAARARLAMRKMYQG